MNMTKRRKIYIVFLVLWLIGIFLLSSRPGVVSAQDSEGVKMALETLKTKVNTTSSGFKLSFNPLVVARKGAHAILYGVLGYLSFNVFLREKMKWMSALAALIFSFCASVLDEFHQTFVPGRTGQVWDVQIDTVSALVVIALTLLIYTFVTIDKRRLFIKGLADRVGAAILLLLLLPIFAMLALVIKLIDGGTILYRQERLGKNAQVFNLLKFRTMKENAVDLRNPDGSTYSGINDPRVTAVGKFLRKSSLDELPQLINILKGDMSFIGPRPDLKDQLELYEGTDYEKLHIKPGITGYAQVMGRNALPWKERFQYDRAYIHDYSLDLDCWIVFKTISVVFGQKDIHTETSK